MSKGYIFKNSTMSKEKQNKAESPQPQVKIEQKTMEKQPVSTVIKKFRERITATGKDAKKYLNERFLGDLAVTYLTIGAFGITSVPVLEHRNKQLEKTLMSPNVQEFILKEQGGSKIINDGTYINSLESKKNYLPDGVLEKKINEETQVLGGLTKVDQFYDSMKPKGRVGGTK